MSNRDIPGTCMACLGRYGARIEPCGVCEARASLEQRADRAAQSWRTDPKAKDLGELLADFADMERQRDQLGDIKPL